MYGKVIPLVVKWLIVSALSHTSFDDFSLNFFQHIRKIMHKIISRSEMEVKQISTYCNTSSDSRGLSAHCTEAHVWSHFVNHIGPIWNWLSANKASVKMSFTCLDLLHLWGEKWVDRGICCHLWTPADRTVNDDLNYIEFRWMQRLMSSISRTEVHPMTFDHNCHSVFHDQPYRAGTNG